MARYEKTFVRLAVLFVTTTALSGCIWPWWGEEDGGRRHHEGRGDYGEHHGEHHDGDRDRGERY